MLLRYVGNDPTLIYGGLYTKKDTEKGVVEINSKVYPITDFIPYTLGIC